MSNEAITITLNSEEAFALLIAQALDQYGLSKNALAALLGVSKNRIRTILKCENLTEKTMANLGSALHMDLQVSLVPRADTLETLARVKSERESRASKKPGRGGEEAAPPSTKKPAPRKTTAKKSASRKSSARKATPTKGRKALARS